MSRVTDDEAELLLGPHFVLLHFFSKCGFEVQAVRLRAGLAAGAAGNGINLKSI